MKYEYVLLLEDFSELKIGSKSILSSATLSLKSESLLLMENNERVWASVPKGSKVTGPKGSFSSSHFASFCMFVLSHSGPLWLISLL